MRYAVQRGIPKRSDLQWVGNHTWQWNACLAFIHRSTDGEYVAGVAHGNFVHRGDQLSLGLAQGACTTVGLIMLLASMATSRSAFKTVGADGVHFLSAEWCLEEH